MEEMRPGVFTHRFEEIAIEGHTRTGPALAAVARAIETQTKTLLTSHGGHRPWEPTPATPGGPPAIISGTLRRSITHDPVLPVGQGWETKVGTAAGFFPHYPVKTHHRKANRKGPTPANKYGMYLETGLRNGATYPFLKPAFLGVVNGAAPAIWAKYLNLGRW